MRSENAREQMHAKGLALGLNLRMLEAIETTMRQPRSGRVREHGAWGRQARYQATFASQGLSSSAPKENYICRAVVAHAGAKHL